MFHLTAGVDESARREVKKRAICFHVYAAMLLRPKVGVPSSVFTLKADHIPDVNISPAHSDQEDCHPKKAWSNFRAWIMRKAKVCIVT